jgi:hypothetical protein
VKRKMVFNATVDLGIALLFAVALAEFMKARHKAERGWNYIAVAGVFLLFAGIPGLGGAELGIPLSVINTIFQVLGWLLALVGTVFVAYESLMER